MRGPNLHARLLAVLAVVAVLLAGLVGRLGQLQLADDPVAGGRLIDFVNGRKRGTAPDGGW